MDRHWIVIAGLAVGLAGGCRGVVQEQDAPVAKEDVPAAVLSTAERFADGGVFESCTRGDEDGLKVFEIVYKKGKRSIEVQTTESGDLVATEEVVAFADLPELVRARALKAFKPGSKLACERALISMCEVAAKDEQGHEIEILVNQAGAAFKEIAGGVLEEGTNGQGDENDAKGERDASIAKKDIPAAVLRTAERFADGGAFERCTRGDEDGLKVFEIVYKKGTRSIEIQTTESGDLVATEEVVGFAHLPELVRARALKAFKPGTKLACERALISMYEIAATDEHGREIEILVNEAGAASKEIAGGILEDGADKEESDNESEKKN